VAGAPIPECLGGDSGENCQPVQAVVLCDEQGPFLRLYLFDCDNGTFAGSIDRSLDGAAYVPVGDISDCGCETCQPYQYRQHREEISGQGVWVRPVDASSVTVKCRVVANGNNPPTITDADLVTTPLYMGDEETWASPDGTSLVDNFTVTTNANDLVTIVWLETVI